MFMLWLYIYQIMLKSNVALMFEIRARDKAYARVGQKGRQLKD